MLVQHEHRATHGTGLPETGGAFADLARDGWPDRAGSGWWMQTSIYHNSGGALPATPARTVRTSRS